jgi:hypothetical protein
MQNESPSDYKKLMQLYALEERMRDDSVWNAIIREIVRMSHPSDEEGNNILPSREAI